MSGKEDDIGVPDAAIGIVCQKSTLPAGHTENAVRAQERTQEDFIMRCGGKAERNDPVNAALAEWRKKAANVLVLASAMAYLPAVMLVIGGVGPAAAMTVKSAVLVCYVIILADTFLNRADYRIRAWSLLAAGYLAAIVGNVIFPQGPFLRVLPVVLPVLTMVFFGAGAGRGAALCSMTILLVGPFLGTVSGLVRILSSDAAPTPISSLPVLFTQSAGLTAVLVSLMLLLDHYHQFLLQSLGQLGQEAARRREAYQDLEREMEERKRLELEVAQAADVERRRLGGEIHDGICQQIAGALLRCEALARRLDRDESLPVMELRALGDLLDESMKEARDVARGLCPLEDDPGALAGALAQLASRTWKSSGIPCRFEAVGDVRIRETFTAHHLYRIAQEAVNNALHHARAGNIAISLQRLGDEVLLQVEDDGCGLPEELPPGGLGLRNMAHRAHFLESDLNVTTAPGGGTRVWCRVPCPAPGPSETYRQRKEVTEYA